MQHEIKIPSMGESIVSGILTRWNVNNGDYVNAGDTIYELETDKITSEGIADVSGAIELLVEADTEVDIGQMVAKIDDSAEAPATATSNEPQKAPEAEPQASDSTAVHPPSVERIAAMTGTDPGTVKGTGKDGRVTKGDMLAAAKETTPPKQEEPASAPPKPVPAAAPRVVDPNQPRTTRKKMTSLRKRIAGRLVAVKNEAAILTTFNEVDMSAVMNVRKDVQEEFMAANGIKLGFMSFFVKAVVKALKAVPAINAQIDGNEIVMNHYYDIGVAVGTDKGLMVPVIRDCDHLSLAGIEHELAGYAKQAREGKIGIESLQGGVFTISNGGVYGSMLSTPILNPPQSGILGMHNIIERPVAVNGKVEIRPMMYLALSYDHRIVDGKEAVTFLIKVKEAIEKPSRLIFDF